MKSMLAEVRLTRPVHDGYVSTEDLIQELLEQEAFLQAALEAALAVIKYSQQTVDINLASQDPEGHLQSLRDGYGELLDELETALEPFRIAGDDAKIKVFRSADDIWDDVKKHGLSFSNKGHQDYFVEPNTCEHFYFDNLMDLEGKRPNDAASELPDWFFEFVDDKKEAPK